MTVRCAFFIWQRSSLLTHSKRSRTFSRVLPWRNRVWITTAAVLRLRYARRARVRRQADWILDATKSRKFVVPIAMRFVMTRVRRFPRTFWLFQLLRCFLVHSSASRLRLFSESNRVRFLAEHAVQVERNNSQTIRRLNSTLSFFFRSQFLVFCPNFGGKIPALRAIPSSVRRALVRDPKAVVTLPQVSTRPSQSARDASEGRSHGASIEPALAQGVY